MRFSIGFAKTFFETTARRIIRFKAAYVESLESDNYDWLDNFPQGKYSQRETLCHLVNDTQLPNSINSDDLVSAESYSMANKVDKFSDNDWNGDQSDFKLSRMRGKALTKGNLW